MKDLTMNEMMAIDGGHYSTRIEKPVSNKEANRFAVDVVTFYGTTAAVAASGTSIGKAIDSGLITAATADFISRIQDTN